ncbi:hypothetical protein SS50377_20770 [Spironucleus salmonicida]|uniref:Uncharacterized protein n=1 Tax=Spironucleus salmonicida TaxID=348837 RepID=V6LTT3_9EUKA|nr:hypothetical protein SS50377_20770 [Spironucleus salmonicida]|eukprot:EST47121.1 Hypothetical protein SS50377_12830 [Spironucleus salmonicida]
MPIKFEDVVHVDPLSRTQRKQITAKTACQEVEKKVQQTKPHFYEDENAFKRKV